MGPGSDIIFGVVIPLVLVIGIAFAVWTIGNKIGEAEARKPPDPMRWVRRGSYLALLLVGWFFILWQNRFTSSPPTVFLYLGYVAVLSTVYALWRTGVTIVSDDEEGDDSTWGRPLGARGELEREKKTLLKAIKEAEFDREMGKLSNADAEEMIGVYRARAIEVIKEIDKLDAGAAGTVREQIERELKARVEIEAKTKKDNDDKQADDRSDDKKRKKKKAPAKAAADAAAAAEQAAAAAEQASAAATPSPNIDSAASAAAADAAADRAAAAAAAAKEAAAEANQAAADANDGKDAEAEAKPDESKADELTADTKPESDTHEASVAKEATS